MMKDATGRDIHPGCKLTYPVFTKGRIVTHCLSVIDVTDEKITGYRDSDGRKIVLRKCENAVVITDISERFIP